MTAAATASGGSGKPVAAAAAQRPGILTLIRLMQGQKVQEYCLGPDYDSEWDAFCVFCEMMRTIVLNKMSCEAEEQVQPFIDLYSSLSSDAERVNLLISHPDVSSILKYFAREFRRLGTEFACAFSKSEAVARSYRQQGDTLLQKHEYSDAALKYSQVILGRRGRRAPSTHALHARPSSSAISR